MRRTLTATIVLAFALAGCSGGGGKDDEKKGAPPPPPSPPPEAAADKLPGVKSLKSSEGLRKPVQYKDKISVAITGIKYTKDKAKGPGNISGQLMTVFTLRFTNGSAAPLNLDKVRVTAHWADGKKQVEASPGAVGNVNDFFGTAAPGQKKSASYVFALPYPQGYKKVSLKITFDAKHRAALFAGTLKP